MAAVRSNTKQGAPFSAWEAMDSLFEQAFSLYSTFSPLVASSPDVADHFSSKLPRSLGFKDPYHKSIPVPRHNDYRVNSLSSSPSSISSVTSFEDYQLVPYPSRAPVPTSVAVRAAKPSKNAKAQPAPTPPPPPTATKTKPRTSRVRYCESTGATRSAIFSLPRVVNGDVHIGFTPGQLEIKWEYTKTKKVQEGGKTVNKQKQKRFTKVLPLRDGTQFSQIKANLSGRQLTISYPK